MKKITAEDVKDMVDYIKLNGVLPAYQIPKALRAAMTPEAVKVFEDSGIKLVVDTRCPEMLIGSDKSKYTLTFGYVWPGQKVSWWRHLPTMIAWWLRPRKPKIWIGKEAGEIWAKK